MGEGEEEGGGRGEEGAEKKWRGDTVHIAHIVDCGCPVFIARWSIALECWPGSTLHIFTSL